MKANENEDLTW